MPDPRDPDTEDRRNDRDLDNRTDNKIEVEEYVDEVVIDLDMFDDESIMVEFDDLYEDGRGRD